jgi:hypothetical protein
MIRRSTVGACACAAALLVLASCSAEGRDTNSSATGNGSGSATTRANGGTGTRAPTTVKQGGIASRTLPAVGVGRRAALAPMLFASVRRIERTTITAQSPGETSGPGVFVTVRIQNDTDAAVDLSRLAINAHYGNGIPAVPIRRGSELEGDLAPGAIKSGRYAFRVPRKLVPSVVIDIQHSSAPNVVIVKAS